MERTFGAEMARVFGGRLKRLYETEDVALPAHISAWLERLRCAEQELAAGTKPESEPPAARG